MKPLNNLHEQDLVQFIAFLSLIPLVLGTIHTYISGVHHHLKICLLPDFQNSFMIALVLRGLTLPEHQEDICLPISIMLHKMHGVLPLITHAYNATMFAGVLALGFFGLFHPGELTNSPHVIRFENVHVANQAIVIKMLSSKCSKAQVPHLLCLWVKPYMVCSVKALKNYLNIRPPYPGLLFVLPDGHPLTRHDLTCMLNQVTGFL